MLVEKGGVNADVFIEFFKGSIRIGYAFCGAVGFLR
jgi:hypothetical protein